MRYWQKKNFRKQMQNRPEPELPEIEQPAMQELKEQEPSTATNGAELMPTEDVEPATALPELPPEQAPARAGLRAARHRG